MMNTPTTRDGWVSMPPDEFERLIEGAAPSAPWPMSAWMARALVTLLQTDGVTSAAALQSTWDEGTQALFAAVMSFWFGSRRISKMRRGD